MLLPEAWGGRRTKAEFRACIRSSAANRLRIQESGPGAPDRVTATPMLSSGPGCLLGTCSPGRRRLKIAGAWNALEGSRCSWKGPQGLWLQGRCRGQPWGSAESHPSHSPQGTSPRSLQGPELPLGLDLELQLDLSQLWGELGPHRGPHELLIQPVNTCLLSTYQVQWPDNTTALRTSILMRLGMAKHWGRNWGGVQ